MTPCPAIAIVAGMESQTKRVTLRCKLISPFLGDQRSASNVRRLDSTTQDGVTYFLPSNAQWRWALKEAMDAQNIEGKTDRQLKADAKKAKAAAEVEEVAVAE